MLTLEKFQASKKTLSIAEAAETLQTDEGAFEGFKTVLVYADRLYIGDLGEGAPNGRFYLILEREDWFSDDLAELEARLYEYDQGEVIGSAASHSNLDDACREVQDAFGITDGGIAGMYFSGPEGEEWPTATHERREEMLRAWLRLEVPTEELGK